MITSKAYANCKKSELIFGPIFTEKMDCKDGQKVKKTAEKHEFGHFHGKYWSKVEISMIHLKFLYISWFKKSKFHLYIFLRRFFQILSKISNKKQKKISKKD